MAQQVSTTSTMSRVMSSGHPDGVWLEPIVSDGVAFPPIWDSARIRRTICG
nr:hypothetical protein [Kibdelosporangium sp. MJ126-NF4]CTQ90628.1 hypothetical protein [Kibdelosporangium sp. MJ126-NF4]